MFAAYRKKDGKTAVSEAVFLLFGRKKDGLGAMLTDLENPDKILKKASKPILEPEASYETEGFFGGVVFTCGGVLENSRLSVYYGAADDKIARAEFSMEEIQQALEQ